MNASSPSLGLPASSGAEASGACHGSQPTLVPGLLQQMEQQRLALDHIWQGLCMFDVQQRLQLFNRLYAEMYDLDPSQLWIGMTLRDVVTLRYAAGSGPGIEPEEYAAWRDRVGIAVRVVDTEVTLRDGRVHAIHHEPIPDGGWVATFEDITERRRAEAHVRHMAHHDSLTSLPNRTLFIERLERSLARLRGESRLEDHRAAPAIGDGLVAVLFLDLDHFKRVNDTLGHGAGDALLRQVCERIGQCLRSEDTLARFGGDKFAILLGKGFTTEEQVTEVARLIFSAVSAPYMLDGQAARVGVSIALCTRNDGNNADPALLLRRADMALYQTRMQGRGSYRFFKAVPGLRV